MIKILKAAYDKNTAIPAVPRGASPELQFKGVGKFASSYNKTSLVNMHVCIPVPAGFQHCQS